MPKAKIKIQPVHFDDHVFTMADESDRGAILIGSHVLDTALAFRVRYHLSRKKDVIKKAIDPLFDNSRPLSSFWAKTNLAYAMSIIDEWAYRDLNTMREIRNKLAHSYTAFSFETPDMHKLIFQLHSTRIAYGHPKKSWTVARSIKKCREQAIQWESEVGQLYFTLGFHYLHGYLTNGIAYKKQNKKGA
jgi:DNA-binding MltR family transcriptional regulator